MLYNIFVFSGMGIILDLNCWGMLSLTTLYRIASKIRQGLKPVKDRLHLTRDTSTTLLSKYIIIYLFYTKQTMQRWSNITAVKNKNVGPLAKVILVAALFL